MLKILVCTATAIASALTAAASDSPVMGWSSWNTYRVDINDWLIMRQADAMVSTDLKKAGYRYINIDDGYFGGRADNGTLLIHPTRFPNGLKPVVDHIHALGLKAGIYSDAGRNTCGNYYDNDTIAKGVGMYGHDREDAEFFFNDLGFDFIKVDFCGGDAPQNSERLALDERQRYTAIAEAIANTGRKDVRLNVCRWDYPGTWVHEVASSWRISHDITPRWTSVKDIISQNLYLSAYCRGGRFNDMDMLEVGRGMTEEEDRTHFGMWCMMTSPLLIGCDMTAIDSTTLALLSNPELIAINQDRLCRQAYPVKDTGSYCVLVKDLDIAGGPERAIAFYNPTDTTVIAEIAFDDIEMAGSVEMRDIIGRSDTGEHTATYTVTLPPHGVSIYRARCRQRIPRKVYEAETAYITAYQELRNNQEAMTGTYERDQSCSCGAKTTWLGGYPDNDLIWDNVTVPHDGRYRISIRVLTTALRQVTVNVNGSDAATFDVDHDGYVTATVDLHRGRNTIRLHNDTAPMPDIDYMTVEAG